MLKQKAETLERQSEQQAQIIRELKRDLETKRNTERKLRSELSSCESTRQSLQTALEDSTLKGPGAHIVSGMCYAVSCFKRKLEDCVFRL